MNHIEKMPIEEALVHFGVLGMKWGVRKKTDAQLRKKIEKKQAKEYQYELASKKAYAKSAKLDYKVRTGLAKKSQYKKWGKNQKRGAKYALKALKVNKKISKLSSVEIKRGQEYTQQLLSDIRDLKIKNA